MGTSRRASLTRVPDLAGGLATAWTADQSGLGPLLPAVRIAPARELAAAALTAPLLRQALRLARWIGANRLLTARGLLRPADALEAITTLDIGAEGPFGQPALERGAGTRPVRNLAGRLRSAADVRELHLVWQTGIGAGLIVLTGRRACARTDSLDRAAPEAVLAAWQGALDVVLRGGPPDVNEEVEGLAVLLYATGRPVRMDSLADAFAAAIRARRTAAARGSGHDPAGGAAAARMSQALEVLADLGVADVGIDEDEQLTAALTPLGMAGMRERLAAAGFAAPVAGSGAASDAAGLLAGLSGYDAEDGEAEIAAWLAQRTPQQAAGELLDAAALSAPGPRAAAFAILDRLGTAVVPLVEGGLADPVLRPHAAIWLRERGVAAELTAAEKAWLLVDLGAGLLEDANPAAVAADLLPELPEAEQAELVGSLWRVSHPGVVELLTTLAEFHPDPYVAKAARKAAFKARSADLGPG